MKRIIVFKSEEWNSLRNLICSGPYPYLCIHNDRVIATNKKVATIRKLSENYTKGKKIFIHSMYIIPVYNKAKDVRIRITDKSVTIRQPNGVVKEISGAFDPVKNYPDIKKLSVREKGQTDNSVTFSISRNTLSQLLDCSTSSILHITVHEESVIAKWKGKKEIGFFSQVHEKQN